MLKTLFESGIRHWDRYLDRNLKQSNELWNAKWKTTVTLHVNHINEEFPDGDFIGRVFYTQEGSDLHRVNNNEKSSTSFSGLPGKNGLRLQKAGSTIRCATKPWA